MDLLVNTKSELHALDSPGLCVLACFSISFFFYCSLSYHVGVMVAFEVGRFEFFNASTSRKKNKSRKTSKLKKLIKNEPSFFFVQLVAHTFRELLEFSLRLCIVGVDHEILKVP